MKKIIIFILILFTLCGCTLNSPSAHCYYNYTDINGNKGILKYCDTKISGKMVCTSGDFSYNVQVVQYDYFCEE